MKHVLIAAALSTAAPIAGHAATFQVFTDRDAFEDVAGDTISFDLTSAGSILSITGDDVSIVDGVLTDVIDQDEAPDTVFDISLPVFGFGADIDTSLVGPGSGISIGVSFEGIAFALPEGIPSPFETGFFGFISDTAFDSVFFSEGDRVARPVETYALSNPIAALNIAEVAPVPLPAGLPLLAVALGALGFARSRRKVS